MSIAFRILGPLEVGAGSGPAPAGRARDLLCLLLVHRGAVVPTDVIVDALWEASPPRSARNAVQVVASRLRARVGDAVFTETGGYGVRLAPGALDADRFEQLFVRGRDELAGGRPAEAAATLRTALGLWRGPALADVRRLEFAHPEVARLDGLRLACTAERIAADLAAGGGGELLAELEPLVAAHPLDERLRELQMLALYRSGRQADALAAYRTTRSALVAQLGLEPGPALRRLERDILRQEVAVPAVARRPAPAAATRRQVTCVYVRGSFGDRDPELLRMRTERLAGDVRTACDRHGGAMIDRRADGVLAVFGIPAAREDDPLRAVRAAEQLQTMIPQVAAGVCSGVVIAAADGVDGEPITTAEQLARTPGEVRIAEATRALIDGRGAPLAVRPMVGRTTELERLVAARRAAIDDDRWAVVTVIGEPGIGKSRLAAALPEALPTGAGVFAGRCPPYGGTTFQPLREIIEQVGAARPFQDLTSPWALCQFLAGRGATLVLDDLHWAEPGLLELLADSGRRSDAPGVLLVCLARPELLETWPGWGDELIELQPLSAAESARLLDGIGEAALDGRSRARVAETAGGNPLFLEQLATYVGDTAAEGALPPALQGLLAARLDLLEPDQRTVLRLGSIQGPEFTPDAVHALAEGMPLARIEQACDELERRRMVTATGDAFRFRHALIREAAYDSLSKASRARLHERHAERLALAEPAPPDRAALIGFQLESAYACAAELGRSDAGALAVRAREALAAAADDAHRNGNLPDEIGHLERAIRLPGEPESDRVALLPTLTAALYAAGSFERALEVSEQAVERARALDAPIVLARAVIERERIRLYQGQATFALEQSIQVTEQALATLESLGDELGQARAHFLRSELHWMDDGDVVAAHASAERMLDHAVLAGSQFEASDAVGFISWGLAMGPTPAADALARMDQLCAGHPDLRIGLLELAGLRGLLLAMTGEFGEARREMARSRSGMAELGLSQASAYMALFDGQLETLAGDAAAAEQAVRDAMQIINEIHDQWFLSTALVDLAHAILRHRGWREARAAVAAIDEVPAPSDAEWVMKRHAARALVAAGEGRLPAAVEEARAATAAADRTSMLVYRADAHRVLSLALTAAGDAAGAETARSETLRLYAAKQNTAAAARFAADLVVSRA